MKLLLLLLVTACSLNCNAQDFAAITRPVNEHFIYSPTSFTETGRAHAQGILGKIGTYTMLGGAVITIAGYIEVRNGTKTDGPFTFVNQSEINAGHAVEYIGGGLFAAGLTMIIIDAVNRHHGSRVSVVAPERNEMGVAYSF